MKHVVIAALAVAFLLGLAGCAGGVKFRSPVAEAAKLQSPVEVNAKPKTEACAPVYKPPVPHIDTGDNPCPNGKCAVPGAPDLPGHDQKKDPAPGAPPGMKVSSLVLGAIAFVVLLLAIVLKKP